MTVGIALTNGLEAIVVTDSRVSGYGRQSDSFDKIGKFNKNGYHGAVFAAGNANLALGILSKTEEFAGDTFDSYVNEIQKTLHQMIDSHDESVIERFKRELEKKAAIYSDKEARKSFIEDSTSKKTQEMDRDENERGTGYVIVAYDKNKKKARIFTLSLGSHLELFSPYITIGSGSDGAQMHMMTKLQGIDPKKLSSGDLTFFATNAYSLATVNQGVGGAPKIIRITEKDNEELPTEKVCALTNISGAYLAEFGNTHRLRDCFLNIFNDKKTAYKTAAKKLEITEDALRTMLTPYNSWQGRANSRRFRK